MNGQGRSVEKATVSTPVTFEYPVATLFPSCKSDFFQRKCKPI